MIVIHQHEACSHVRCQHSLSSVAGMISCLTATWPRPCFHQTSIQTPLCKESPEELTILTKVATPATPPLSLFIFFFLILLLLQLIICSFVVSLFIFCLYPNLHTHTEQCQAPSGCPVPICCSWFLLNPHPTFQLHTLSICLLVFNRVLMHRHFGIQKNPFEMFS